MTAATHHARPRLSLLDRLRNRKPGTTPVATAGEDVIGTAPALHHEWVREHPYRAPASFGGASMTGVMPAPAVHDGDPDWDAILTQYERSRQYPPAWTLRETSLVRGGPSLAETTTTDTPPAHARPYAAPPRPRRGPAPIYDHLVATWPDVRPKYAAIVRLADHEAWMALAMAALTPDRRAA